MAREIATTSTAALSAWTDPRPAIGGGSKPSVLDELWIRFDGRWQNAWTSRFTTPESMENWKRTLAEDLVAEGITGKEFARGVEALRRLKFPPNVPEFLALCRPILDDEEAYIEAMSEMPKRLRPREENGQLVSDDEWTEPAIYWAAKRMWHDLENRQWRDVKTRWKRELERARREKAPLPPPVCRALPFHREPSIKPEEQKRIISDLLGKVGGAVRFGSRKTAQQEAIDLEDAKRRAQAEVELAQMRLNARTEGA